MATPRPTIHIPTTGLSRPEVIVLLCEAIRNLRWGLGYLHPMRAVAQVPPQRWSKGEDVTIEIDDAGLSMTSKPSEWSPFAKKARHQENLDRLVVAFAQARNTMSPELMASELKELDESGVMLLDASTARNNEFRWKDLGHMLVPRKDFLATPLLLDISVLVYIAMVLSGVHFMQPTSEDLVMWGANWRNATLGGEWWRLLTCCFVHIGIIHLLLNMYALLMIGIHLEPLLGKWRMIALYVITGICASITSLWWHDNTVSAGASGAIFGLYGVFLALLFTDIIHKDVRKQLLSSIGLFVVYNLIYGLKGNVDNAAHLGGLLSGVVLGFTMYIALRKPEQQGLAWGTMVLPAAVLFGGGAVALGSLPGDDAAFLERIGQYDHFEADGLALFDMPEDATGDVQLKILEEKSAPAWDSAWVLLGTTKEMDLSPAMARHRDRIIAYTKERMEHTALVRRVLQGEEGLSGPIQASSARIEAILEEMKSE
ncbi:MAG TPA: rhomboid family intramembrane serine protease [Flavobacteriales bacterium]